VDEVKQLAGIIEEFVRGKLNFAKHRFYQKKTEGGLELIDIHEYLAAQNCSWIRRAYSLDDLWKKELFCTVPVLYSTYVRKILIKI